MKLKNIGAIYSGFSFREKIRHDPSGDVSVVQLRSLLDDYTEIDSELDSIGDIAIKPKYFLSNNDILLVAKGAHNYAVRCDSLPEKAIASSSFFIVKIKNDKILPGYLHWFLNHPNTQNELRKKQSGTYTPTLKIAEVQNIEIPLPTKEKQIAIANLYKLQVREKQLQNKLIIKRKDLMDNMLINTIHK